MAVANFHYITRMSSGFKVYILEGGLVYVVSLSFFTHLNGGSAIILQKHHFNGADHIYGHCISEFSLYFCSLQMIIVNTA